MMYNSRIKEFIKSSASIRRLELGFNRIKYFLLLIFLTNCKGNVDIFNSDNIAPTHTIKDSTINSILNHFFDKNETYKNWRSYDDKILFLSIVKETKNTFKIRGVVSNRKKYAVPFLKNNYSAYFQYRNTLIIFWGDDDYFLQKIKSKKKNIFNRKSLSTIDNGEFFGCEFIIRGKELIVLKDKYFSRPILPFYYKLKKRKEKLPIFSAQGL